MKGHVEFVGLGGAGKSTLIRQLVTADPRLRVASPGQAPRMALATAGARLTAAAVPDLAWLGGHGGRRLLQTLARRRAASRLAEGVIAEDGGFLEPFVTHAMYFAGRERTPPAERLLRVLPPAGAVILVRCAPEVAWERFRDREARLGRLDMYGDIDGFPGRFQLAAELAERLARHGAARGATLIEVDTTRGDPPVEHLLIQLRRTLPRSELP